jgi:two-component system LytT family response regulator
MVNSTRILIVDDEAPARAALLEALAAGETDHVVVGEASDREEAVKQLDRLRPDVVLLDIHLGDGTGFEVLERAAWKDARVIFITAYDQYALRAFRVAATDYLLKPVDAELLAQALRRNTRATQERGKRCGPCCATWHGPRRNASWCPVRKGSMCWPHAASCAARPMAITRTSTPPTASAW